jgi:2-polyprenyl-6-methoxyphenol hydroxylase-like FAD-dependent oxidoreductase
VDVLVAGAGPAGSATAALLARAGYSVLAVDRAEFPREKACAEYLSPEAVRILDRLGVVAALEQQGAAPLEGMKVTGVRGATAHGRFAAARHRPYRATGLSISRRSLDYALVRAARAAGATVLERCTLADLLLDGRSVAGGVVRDASGHRHPVQARLTVGADGLRSVVARRIGGRIHGHPRRMAFVAHVVGVADMGSSAELHFGPTSYIGLNRIERDIVNVAVVVPSERASAARGRPAEFFFECLAEFPQVARRMKSVRVVRPIMATGPFAARSRRVVTASSVLVGDAADFYDPVTGDGIFSALRGAELIAETMIPALSDPGPVGMPALRRYQWLRRRAFAGKWFMERVTRYVMYFPGFFDRTVSRLGRYEDMAHTAIGVAGGFVPLREMLKPAFISRVIL